MIEDLNYEDILPAEGIGKIKLGMSHNEVINVLQNYYHVKHREEDDRYDYIVVTDNIIIFFSKIEIINGKSIFLLEDKIVVSRVVVHKKFKGKLFGKIGINSTLRDVSKYAGEWFDNDIDDTYELKNFPGVGFVLKDVENLDEEWDELTYPVESIGVYPKDFYKGWFNVEVVREGKK